MSYIKVRAIDPAEWLKVANARAKKTRRVTPWFPGTTRPVRIGYYERHFTDSQIVDAKYSLHWWDGLVWRATPNSVAHWRQVGDYPCWRGLAQEAPKP